MWLHFDCFSGVSGDMTLGALLDIGVSLDVLRDGLALLDLSGYEIHAERRMVGVLDAVKLRVLLHPSHPSKPLEPTHTHTHVHEHGPQHKHTHPHDHHHDHQHAHPHEHTHDHEHTHEHGHGHDRQHTHDHGHHDHQHTHEYGHGHDRQYAHPHGHHQHTHEYGHDHQHVHEYGHHHEGSIEDGSHRSYADIRSMIERSGLPRGVKERAQAIFLRLAQAEAAVHGMSVEKVSFHEVGAVDSIVDIVGVAIGLEALGIEKVTCSPLPMSRGFVRCQHGRLPLPAPATLEILRGVPVYDSGLSVELVTPTGAAIVAAMAEEFVSFPSFTLQSVGYGAGERQLSDRPNLLRLVLGRSLSEHREEGDLLQVEVNLDDMSPEQLAYVCERLWDAGARDVWQGAIQMKKGRAAHQLSLLCSASKLGVVEDLLFRESSTLGFRFFPVQRRVLERSFAEVQTPWGLVSIKLGRRGDEVVQFAPEYASCRQLAEQHGIPLKEVYAAALGAWASR